MSYGLRALLFSTFLAAGMLVLFEVGRRLGRRRIARDAEGAREGFAPIDGAIFGLLGLLVAFTFSGAASRFDVRREQIVEEANDIGTAYLRLDLLPAAEQAPLRDLFRRYTDSRLDTYRKLPDLAAAEAELARSAALQNEIWTRAVAACRQADPPTSMLLLPALNTMIDITATRTMAAYTHPPMVVFAMLGLLALGSALLAGDGMAAGKTRSWLYMLAFVVTIAITAYVILDLEYPRVGLIRLDAHDRALEAVRQSMR
jgi:hypothetical protein